MNQTNHCGILAAALLLGCIASGITTAQETSELIFRDDFNGRLAEGWSFEREDRANWRVGPAGLEVRVQPGGMWGGGNNAKNVMVHAIPAPTDAPVEISVTFSNQPTARWEQANLVWYYDGGNMVKLGQELVADRLTIVMGREQNDQARTVAIVPLDAYTVELRLQAVRNLIRGQFRTASWPEWRDVGECDLPVKGDPKASLHFYNGAPDDAHWARVNGFTVRRLPASSVNWPRVRAEENSLRSADHPRPDSAWLELPDQFALLTSVREIAAEAKPDYEQSIYRHRDGSYGWRWDRRASAGNQPTVAGVGLGAGALWPDAPQGGFDPIPITSLGSLELEMDVVTRLEIDQGTHNLMVALPLKPAGRITIWLDWYGQASDVQSLNDGYEDYGHVPTPPGTGEIQYRRKTFQGAPPRLNLRAFLDDAVKRGLAPSSEVLGVWLGNEIWTGSRGGTLVTRLNLMVNGRRYSSVPAPL